MNAGRWRVLERAAGIVLHGGQAAAAPSRPATRVQVVIPFHTWTDDQSRKIEQWLNEKWGPDRQCAQCEPSIWVVGRPAMLPLSMPTGGMLLGSGYPCIPVVCNNGDNTVLCECLRRWCDRADQRRGRGQCLNNESANTKKGGVPSGRSPGQSLAELFGTRHRNWIRYRR
jgi:hypothetical protein